MGTRHLTMVIDKEGTTKVAQYGQWDGYVTGQGKTILNFLKRLKKNKTVGSFQKKISKVKFINEAKQKEIDAFFKSIGVNDGWMNMEQAEKYHKVYPLLSRDNGAHVLEMIHKTKNTNDLWVNDETNFAADSLFCEFAYVIDFQKNVLEVYKGFNKKPVKKNSRFAFLNAEAKKEYRGDSQYYPVKLAATYDLSKLPSLGDVILDVEGKSAYNSYMKSKKKESV